MDRNRLLERLDGAWRAFRESYAGLSAARLTEPGVVGDWSVREVIAHVTTWEEEALRQLEETHRRLTDFLGSVPEDELAGETRFRRRLRLDTYGHYGEHARAIREWRSGRW